MKLGTALRLGIGAGVVGFVFGLERIEHQVNPEKVAFYDFRSGEKLDLEKIADGSQKIQNIEMPSSSQKYRMTESELLEATREYIKNFEGKKNRAYKDTRNLLTIGIGHHLTSESREIFAELFPEANFDKIINKKEGLTDKQIDVLFEYDFNRHHQRVLNKIPNYSELPDPVKIALGDMGYRTELFQSPIFCGYIRNGDLRGAAREFLDNSPEYQRALASKKENGIVARRQSNQRLLLEGASELETNKR